MTAIVISSCSKKSFELQDATSKRFGGGTILSGTGIVYTFELKALQSQEKLKIDTVYIRNRSFLNFSIHKKGAKPGEDLHYEKGDIIIVTVTHSKRPLISDGHPPKIIDGEFKENGLPSTRKLNGTEALIIVKVKDKFIDISVQKFTVLEPEMRP